MLTACNTGNLDFSNNVASKFALLQDVDRVIAPDGLGQFISEDYVGSVYYPDYSGVERKGRGFSVFMNTDGQVKRYTGLTEDRSYSMIMSIYNSGVATSNMLKKVYTVLSQVDETLKKLTSLD